MDTKKMRELRNEAIASGMPLLDEHGIAMLDDKYAEGFRAGMRAAADRVPSNWCDPLLTGPNGIGRPPWDCRHITNLLNGVRATILAEADK